MRNKHSHSIRHPPSHTYIPPLYINSWPFINTRIMPLPSSPHHPLYATIIHTYTTPTPYPLPTTMRSRANSSRMPTNPSNTHGSAHSYVLPPSLAPSVEKIHVPGNIIICNAYYRLTNEPSSDSGLRKREACNFATAGKAGISPVLICSCHCSSASGSSLDASTLLLQIYSTFRSISRLSSRLATKNFHPKPFMLSSWPRALDSKCASAFRFAHPSNLYH